MRAPGGGRWNLRRGVLRATRVAVAARLCWQLGESLHSRSWHQQDAAQPFYTLYTIAVVQPSVITQRASLAHRGGAGDGGHALRIRLLPPLVPPLLTPVCANLRRPAGMGCCICHGLY